MLLDFWECDREVLQKPGALESALRSAARAAGMIVFESDFGKFSDGVSGFLVTHEGYASVRSCISEAYVAVDVYTSGDGVPGPAIGVLSRALGSDTFSVAIIGRGLSRRAPSISVAEVYSERAVALQKDEG